MIDNKFIDEQIDKSKRDNKTSYFIRKFIFKIVDEALIEVYGENYSIRCAQAAEAIKLLLEEFGIKSRIFTGHVCLILTYKVNNHYKFHWGGFWDDTFHMFNVTQFEEIADLTISQLHLDPANIKKKPLAVLPFWWQPLDKWPPIVMYIPEAPAKYGIPDDDKENFKSFITKVKDRKEYYLANSDSSLIDYTDVIYNIDSLNILTEIGNPWLKILSEFMKQQKFTYPDFFQKKDREILNKYSK